MGKYFGEELTATTSVTITMNVTELCDSMDIPAVVGPTEVNYKNFLFSFNIINSIN